MATIAIYKQMTVGQLDDDMRKNEIKPCGYMSITNSCGALIEIDSKGEMARIAFQNCDGKMDVRRWQRIKGNKYPYVVADKRRYRLEKFMRI